MRFRGLGVLGIAGCWRTLGLGYGASWGLEVDLGVGVRCWVRFLYSLGTRIKVGDVRMG